MPIPKAPCAPPPPALPHHHAVHEHFDLIRARQLLAGQFLSKLGQVRFPHADCCWLLLLAIAASSAAAGAATGAAATPAASTAYKPLLLQCLSAGPD